jgi:hypothetical protein
MSTLTYRRTKSGAWAVYGPTTHVKTGATVTVTKKNGDTKQETIASVGKPFTVDGQQMVYGYPDSDTTRSSSGGRRRTVRNPYTQRRPRRCETGGNCSSFGSGQSCGAPDCDGWD